MLDEDREGRVRGEIQRLQNFEVVPLRIDVQEMHVPDRVISEDFGEWRHFHHALDDEGGERAVQILDDVVPVERPQLIDPRGEVGQALPRSGST